jgi:hypothetical protein
MMHIDTSDKSEQRKFGIVMAVAISILGLIRWALHGFEVLPVWFFGIAAAFLLFGLVLPKALQPLFIVWMKFAEVLNWIMTRVFLGIAFYLMISPVRFIIQWFSDDPLKRAWKSAGESYWEAPDRQPETLEDFKNQF